LLQKEKPVVNPGFSSTFVLTVGVAAQFLQQQLSNVVFTLGCFGVAASALVLLLAKDPTKTQATRNR
jgi:hypothetical protein